MFQNKFSTHSECSLCLHILPYTGENVHKRHANFTTCHTIQRWQAAHQNNFFTIKIKAYDVYEERKNTYKKLQQP